MIDEAIMQKMEAEEREHIEILKENVSALEIKISWLQTNLKPVNSQYAEYAERNFDLSQHKYQLFTYKRELAAHEEFIRRNQADRENDRKRLEATREEVKKNFPSIIKEFQTILDKRVNIPNIQNIRMITDRYKKNTYQSDMQRLKDYDLAKAIMAWIKQAREQAAAPRIINPGNLKIRK